MKLKYKLTPFKIIIFVIITLMLFFMFCPIINKWIIQWQGLIGSSITGFLSIYAVYLTYEMKEKNEDRKNKERIICYLNLCNIFDSLNEYKFHDSSCSIEVTVLISILSPKTVENRDYIIKNLKKIKELVVEVDIPIKDKEGLIYSINDFINNIDVFEYINDINIENNNNKSILKFKDKIQYGKAKTMFGSIKSINYIIEKCI